MHHRTPQRCSPQARTEVSFSGAYVGDTSSRLAPANLERHKYVERLNNRETLRVIGSAAHADCQFTVTSLLKPIAKRTAAKVLQEWTIAHGEDWLIPDVVLTYPNRFATDKHGYLADTPLLCIEILSPGQMQSELLRKCAQYHAWGVPHCWVIDPIAKIGFESQNPDTFKLIAPDGILTAGEISLPVAEIWAD